MSASVGWELDPYSNCTEFELCFLDHLSRRQYWQPKFQDSKDIVSPALKLGMPRFESEDKKFDFNIPELSYRQNDTMNALAFLGLEWLLKCTLVLSDLSSGHKW